MRLRCVLTCRDPARRFHEVRNRGRNWAASNPHRSNVPRRHRSRIPGRTCRDPSNGVNIGTPADRPGCTYRPASQPCSSICRKRRRRDRCSWDRDNWLKNETIVFVRDQRNRRYTSLNKDMRSFGFECFRHLIVLIYRERLSCLYTLSNTDTFN